LSTSDRAGGDGSLVVTAPRLSIPKISVALASGYHTPGDLRSFMFVGKTVRQTWRVANARLHPCDSRGEALRLAREIWVTASPAARTFVMRVVVTGDWEKPDQVVEAWRLDGPEPRFDFYCI
jgi:hypothetical protein